MSRQRSEKRGAHRGAEPSTEDLAPLPRDGGNGDPPLSNERESTDAGEFNQAARDELLRRVDAAERKTLVYQADLENFRQRKNRETAEQLKFASLPIVEKLLEVVDNLNRALESVEREAGDAGTLTQGVEMVAGQLRNILESNGCVRIESIGEPFDPHQHEAIQMQAADARPNTVIAEVQSGYKMHDRIIRPARVIVSTGPADSPQHAE